MIYQYCKRAAAGSIFALSSTMCTKPFFSKKLLFYASHVVGVIRKMAEKIQTF